MKASHQRPQPGCMCSGRLCQTAIDSEDTPAVLMGRAQSPAAARASASVAAVTVSRFQASATASAAAPTAIEPFAWTPMTGDFCGLGTGPWCCAAGSGDARGGAPSARAVGPTPWLCGQLHMPQHQGNFTTFRCACIRREGNGGGVDACPERPVTGLTAHVSVQLCCAKGSLCWLQAPKVMVQDLTRTCGNKGCRLLRKRPPPFTTRCSIY